MKTQCNLCGKEAQITKLHKDYNKIAANPTAIFICTICSSAVWREVLQQQRGIAKKK